MQMVCDYADDENLTLYLYAAPIPRTSGLARRHLIEFYRLFGFELETNPLMADGRLMTRPTGKDWLKAQGAIK